MVIESIWQDFLSLVAQEAGSRVVETWLKAIVPVEWDARRAIMFVRAPNSFVQDWVISHYTQLFDKHLARLLGVSSITVTFVATNAVQVVGESLNLPGQVVVDLAEKSSATTCIAARREQTAITPSTRVAGVNGLYLFDTFVVGPSNQLSCAAARAVTEKPGLIYNPLFIYGGPGLGKTHLLHAIGNEIKRQHRRLDVLYQTADRFVNEFIQMIRCDRVHAFRQKYCRIDVLLIDDIQFIANKDQTQEAFFHIFNALYDASKQIVFSSDVYPGALNGIADRLKSRLEWGLVTDISHPTLEEKIAIIRRKMTAMSASLDDEVVYELARQASTSIRELEGSLVRLLAFASLTDHPVGVDLVQRVLARPAVPATVKRASYDDVLHAVSKHCGYSVAQLRSRSRNHDLVRARQLAMFLMKRLTGQSLRDVGEFLRRDHTAVLHALEKVDHLLKADESFAALARTIESAVQSK